MLILFTYKLLKGYLTCLKLNQFGFRWMCSRRILGDITPRTPTLRCARALERAFTGRAVTGEYTPATAPLRALYENKIVSRLRRYLDKHATYQKSAGSWSESKRHRQLISRDSFIFEQINTPTYSYTI